MCSSNVKPEARKAMADLLRDMAAALDPEHPEAVQVGPVDFGTPTRHIGAYTSSGMWACAWYCPSHAPENPEPEVCHHEARTFVGPGGIPGTDRTVCGKCGTALDPGFA